MNDMISDIEHLAREIGPRPAGTEEERVSAMYIAEKLQKRSGLSFNIEDFEGAKGKTKTLHLCSVITSVILLIALFLTVTTIPAIILTLIVAIIVVMEALDKPVLSNYLKNGISQNVVVKYEPSYSPEKQATQRKRKIVLLSHYDSGHHCPNDSSSYYNLKSIFSIISVFCCCFIPILLLLKSVLCASNSGSSFFVFFAVALLVICLVLIPLIMDFLESKRGYNEAANCNASGCAALIEIGKMLGLGSYDEINNDSTFDEPVVRGYNSSKNYAPRQATVDYQAKANTNDNVDPLLHKEQGLADAKAAVAAFTKPRKPRDNSDEQTQTDQNLSRRSTGKNSQFSQLTQKIDSMHNSKKENLQNNNLNDSNKAESIRSNNKEKDTNSFTEPSNQEINKVDTVQADNNVKKTESSVPDWYKTAQSRAKKQDSTADNKPNTEQRSRFAHTLDLIEQRKIEEQKRQEAEQEAEKEKLREELKAAQEAKEADKREMLKEGSPFFRKDEANKQVANQQTIQSENENVGAASTTSMKTVKNNAAPVQSANQNVNNEPVTDGSNNQQVAINDEGESLDKTQNIPTPQINKPAADPNLTQVQNNQTASGVAPNQVQYNNQTASGVAPNQVQNNNQTASGISTNRSENHDQVLNVNHNQVESSASMAQAQKTNTNTRRVFNKLEDLDITSNEKTFADNTPKDINNKKVESDLNIADRFKRNLSTGNGSASIDTNIKVNIEQNNANNKQQETTDKYTNTVVPEIAKPVVAKPLNSASASVDNNSAEQNNLNNSPNNIINDARASVSNIDMPIPMPNIPEINDNESTSFMPPVDINANINVDVNKQVDDKNVEVNVSRQVDVNIDNKNFAPVNTVQNNNIDAPINLDQSKQYAPLASEDFVSGTDLPENSSMIDLPEVIDSDNPEADQAYMQALKQSDEQARQEEIERGKFGTGSFAAVSENDGMAGSTGAFAPVGENLVEEASLSGHFESADMIVQDADDSIYQEGQFTEQGAFSGESYVDIPETRKKGFFGKFFGGKKEQGKHSHKQDSKDDVSSDLDNWDGGGFSALGQKMSDMANKIKNNPDSYNQLNQNEQDYAAYEQDYGQEQDMMYDNQYYDDQQRPITDENSRIEAIVDPVPDFDKQIQDFHRGSINVEVWMVALGSEIDENAGIKSFILEHAHELSGAIFVDIEGLADGNLSLVDSEGMIKKTKTPARIKRYVRTAANKLGMNIPSINIPWSKSSAYYINKSGMKAIRLVGAQGNKPAHYMEQDDNMDNIHPEILSKNVDYIMQLLQTI